jgi:hypothetical protein
VFRFGLFPFFLFLARFFIPAQHRITSRPSQCIRRSDLRFVGEYLAKQVAVDRRLAFGFEFLSGIRHFDEGPSLIRLKNPPLPLGHVLRTTSGLVSRSWVALLALPTFLRQPARCSPSPQECGAVQPQPISTRQSFRLTCSRLCILPGTYSLVDRPCSHHTHTPISSSSTSLAYAEPQDELSASQPSRPLAYRYPGPAPTSRYRPPTAARCYATSPITNNPTATLL